MNLLVFSPLSFPALNKYLPDWSLASEFGLSVTVRSHPNITDEKPDAILCMSVSRTEETLAACHIWPNVPLFVMHWDCYSWVWTRPRKDEYDYTAYGHLIKQAEEVWVPSTCTGRQASLWWNIYNWHVVRPAAPVPPVTTPVRDGGYAYCALRTLPDSWCDKFVEACEELQIPYACSDHQDKFGTYVERMANCRFIVNHYIEASTGGLTLLEAYALGKPVLCTDSEWNGAREFFGDRAQYFHHGDYLDFKNALKYCYEHPPYPQSDQREWVERNFSDRAMLERITERLHANLD